MRRAGWRILVSASGVHRAEGMRYAIDNGAWSAYRQGKDFDANAFSDCLDLLGDGADWIVIPDIVAGGLDSLRFSRSWYPDLEAYGKLLLPVQDGMEPSNVRSFLDDRCGIFLGGTTEWKLSTMNQWGELARECDCYFHVARVNSKRRIGMCQEAGAHSFDGTSVTMYSKTLPPLDAARRQRSIWDVDK
jgi:hypothetical protein